MFSKRRVGLDRVLGSVILLLGVYVIQQGLHRYDPRPPEMGPSLGLLNEFVLAFYVLVGCALVAVAIYSTAKGDVEIQASVIAGAISTRLTFLFGVYDISRNTQYELTIAFSLIFAPMVVVWYAVGAVIDR